MNNPILDAAIGYAKHGLSVFPVEGKRPVTPEGMLNATTNLEVIEAWWKRRPNWGVAIRIPPWAVIIDVDGPIGYEALAANGFDLPATLISKTNRGDHRWYRKPEEGAKVQRKINFLPKVDILTNGYVVAPPSPHPLGGFYHWDDLGTSAGGDSYIESMIEIAPKWTIDTIKFQMERKEVMDIDDLFKGIPPGERQTKLFLYACSLRGRGKTTIREAKALVKELANICKWDGDTEGIVDRVWRSYDKNEARDREEEKEVVVRSLAELATAHLTPTPFLVKGLLPASGYTVLSSPPKKGKSLLAAELALSISSGVPWMSNDTIQAGVLYLDLEQDDGDAMERWDTLRQSMGLPWPHNLFTVFEHPSADNGGFEKIAETIVQHPTIRLVIIDTLADFFLGSEGAGNIYYDEQKFMRLFNPFSKDYGVGFLLVHHDRKAPTYANINGDMIDHALGSYAIVGKAKAVWHFARKEGADDGILKFTGKKVWDGKYKLQFNRQSLRWNRLVECDQNP